MYTYHSLIYARMDAIVLLICWERKIWVCVHVFLSVCRFILDRRPFHPFVTDDQPTNNGGSWVIPSSSFGTFRNLPLFSIYAVWNLDAKSWLLWQPNWGVTGRDCSSFEIFWCESNRKGGATTILCAAGWWFWDCSWMYCKFPFLYPAGDVYLIFLFFWQIRNETFSHLFFLTQF